MTPKEYNSIVGIFEQIIKMLRSHKVDPSFHLEKIKLDRLMGGFVNAEPDPNPSLPEVLETALIPLRKLMINEGEPLKSDLIELVTSIQHVMMKYSVPMAHCLEGIET